MIKKDSNKSVQSFYKIGIFKNFAKVTRKYLCWSLFINKFAGIQPCNFIQQDIPAQVFSCNFSKLLIIPH